MLLMKIFIIDLIDLEEFSSLNNMYLSVELVVTRLTLILLLSRNVLAGC